MNHTKRVILATIICLIMAVSVRAVLTDPMTGSYFGSVIVTSPAKLGSIDLALYLDVANNAVNSATSYVMADKTLVFPEILPKVCRLIPTEIVPPKCTSTATCVKVIRNYTSCATAGPRVSGSLVPRSSLSFGPFEGTVGDKKVTRQVFMNISSVIDGNRTIHGTYRETVTGLGSGPITVTGPFYLSRSGASISESLQPSNGTCITVADIRTAGSKPTVIEYNDLSKALHLYHNPGITPNLCTSPDSRDKIISDALNEYYLSQ